jgi:CheY-like chemotaxis protein
MNSAVTILLLDDEPLLRRATALLLSRQGARVTAVGTLDEAAALAGRHLFDVAVFDVAAAGASPAEVGRRLREGGLPPRRLIAVTRAPLDGREAEGLAAVLVVPYPFDSLERAVFSDGERRRTRSGVFPCAPPPRPSFTGRGSRGAARAGRDRAG